MTEANATSMILASIRTRINVLLAAERIIKEATSNLDPKGAPLCRENKGGYFLDR